MLKSPLITAAIGVAVALASISAHAQQTYTTMPLGGGMSVTTGPNGSSYTTMPLGGGMSVTTGPNGYNATTMPLGGGMSTTTVNPGFGGYNSYGSYGYGPRY